MDARPATAFPHTGEGADTLEELYAEHHTRLVRMAVLLLRDRGRAEEIVQDAFVELLRRGDRVREPAAYLRASVLNRCRSAGRHLGVVTRKAHFERPVDPAGETLGRDVVRRHTVLAALAELPARQREVLVLRHYLDLPEKEVARTLGISVGAVKSHTSRGSAALRTLLADHLEER